MSKNGDTMNTCAYCNIGFIESTKQSGRQKYCSKKCRVKAWRVNNLEYSIDYNKKYRKNVLLQNPRYCRICEKVLTLRARGKYNGLFCSLKCSKHSQGLARVRRNAQGRKRGKEVTLAFHAYKVSLGCSKCGYNKFGGSLDFHHVNPQDKERRIERRHWFLQTELIKQELAKCVLLCKNCHYEEHERLRDEATS